MLAADVVAGSSVDDPIPVRIERGSANDFSISDPSGLRSRDPFHRESCTHGGTPCVGRSGTLLIVVPCRPRKPEEETDHFRPPPLSAGTLVFERFGRGVAFGHR